MQRANGLDVAWLDADEAAATAVTLSPTGHRGGSYLATDGAIDPPRNVRAYSLAMQAAGVELRERTVVHRPADRAGRRRRQPGPRRRDRRRADRDRSRPADGRPIAARRRAGWPGSASRSAPRGTRSRSSSRTRPSTSPRCRWSSTSAPGCTGGSRRVACCSAGATRTRRPARPARSTGPPTSAARARLAELVPATRGLGLRKIWAATIDYTPDHLPILGPGLDRDGRPIGGVTVASAGGHGMMWGPGVARVAADLVDRDTVERHRLRPSSGSIGSTRRDGAGSRPTRSPCRSRSAPGTTTPDRLCSFRTNRRATLLGQPRLVRSDRSERQHGRDRTMVDGFFSEVAEPIRFGGLDSTDPLTFKVYQPDRLVLGKRMEDHLRIGVCLWHSFNWPGSDVFGVRDVRPAVAAARRRPDGGRPGKARRGVRVPGEARRPVLLLPRSRRRPRGPHLRRDDGQPRGDRRRGRGAHGADRRCSSCGGPPTCSATRATRPARRPTPTPRSSPTPRPRSRSCWR